MTLTISTEWLPGADFSIPEFAATWCRLAVTTDSATITLVQDVESGSTRQAIYCPAYPLAEWIAASWWTLTADVRSAPSGNSRARHRISDHNIRSTGDGFAWPSLEILPAGLRTAISWSADDVRSRRPVRFLSSGQVWAPSTDVARGLSRFVDDVVERLREGGIRGTRLQEDWSDLAATPPDVADFCRVAANLGVDPYDVDDQTVDAILRAEAQLGSRLMEQVASVAQVKELSQATAWAREAMQLLMVDSKAEPTANQAALPQARPQDLTAPPWEVGWEAGRLYRAQLGLAPELRFDVETRVKMRRLDTTPPSPAFHGACRFGDGTPVTATHRTSVEANRFIGARALWRTATSGEDVSLLSSASTYDAQVERAFAAEVLAPRDGLAVALAGLEQPFVTQKLVNESARHYGVSPVLTAHQFSNQFGLDLAEV